MIEALVNLLIWFFKTIFSDGFWTFLSVIAIIIGIYSIVAVAINREKDCDGKEFIQIAGSVLILIIAGIILSITLR